MKVIKQGKLPTATMKCGYCGCEFEFDKRDVKISSLGATVICPFCKIGIYLDGEHLMPLKLPYPKKSSNFHKL